MASSSSPKEKPIRLVLIEDHADFRESVSMVLEERGGYQCVGGFSTMEDALEAFPQKKYRVTKYTPAE